MHRWIFGAVVAAIGLLLLFVGIEAHAAQTVVSPSLGGTGTNTTPSYGQVLVGNSGGTYTPTATSSLGIPAGVTSVFGRTGAVAAQNGDYTTSQVTEGSNLYWTNTRFDNRLSATTSLPNITTLANLLLPTSQLSGTISNGQLANSSLSVTATGPLTGGGTVSLGGSTSIGCQTASASQAGCLSSTDWTTFNGKNGWSWPFPNNATSTAISFGAGLVSNGSTTIAGLTSGLVGNNNGLLYSFASSSLFGFTPVPFGFTPQSDGNATGTELILKNGFLSTASSSVNANFTVTGSVGIATTTPSAPLDVYGTTNGAEQLIEGLANNLGLTITNYGTGAVPWNILSTNNSASIGGGLLAFSYGAFGSQTNALVLKNNGSVGIGTTTPYSLLTLYTAGSTAAASPQLVFSASSTVTGVTNALQNWSIGTNIADGGKFEIASSSVLGTNNRFIIDGSGNVGIATNTPSQKLSVNGESELDNGFVIAGSGGGNTIGIASSSAYYLYQDTSGALDLGRTNWNFLMKIDALAQGGNLHFAPNGANISFEGGGNNAASSSPFARLSLTGQAGGTKPLLGISTSTAGFATSTAFLIDQNGNVGIGTGIISNGSALNVTGQSYFNGNVGIGNSAPSVSLAVGANGGTALQDSAGTPVTSTGLEVNPSAGFAGYAAGFENPGAATGARNVLFLKGVNSDNASFLLRAESSAGATVLTQAGNFGLGTTTPDATLQIRGSEAHNVTRTASNYSIATTTDFLVAITSTASPRTITLPFCTATTTGEITDNVRYVVKDESGGAATNNITVQSSLTGQLIDGATTKVINTNYGFAELYCDGQVNGGQWFTY